MPILLNIISETDRMLILIRKDDQMEAPVVICD